MSTIKYNLTFPFIAVHQGIAWGLVEENNAHFGRGFIFRSIADTQYGHTGCHDTKEKAISVAMDLGAIVVNTKTNQVVKSVQRIEKVELKIVY